MNNNIIVKIQWTEHNREYSIGIMHFLKELGLEATEDEILRVVKDFLTKNG